MNVEETQKEPKFGKILHPGMWVFFIFLGSIMFLYLGWVYQTSWYWYYGIDYIQLNLPLSAIFQQSMALFLLSFSLVVIIFGIIFLLRLITLFLRNFFSGGRRSELASLFSIRDIFQRNIHCVVLICVAIIYLFLKDVEIHNSNYSKLELPANIAMLNAFIIPISFILLFRLLGDFLYILPAGLKQRLRLTAESRINDEHYRIIMDVLVVFAVSTMFIGIMAVGEASVGFRQNASYQAVRRVYLKSYLPIAGLEPYRQDCDCSPYVYGPIGYLGNNEEYLFLIPWKADGEEYFPQFPTLYQIERSSNNTINIIPDGVSPQQESPSTTTMFFRKKGARAERVNALPAPCSSGRLRSQAQEELAALTSSTSGIASVLRPSGGAFKGEL